MGSRLDTGKAEKTVPCAGVDSEECISFWRWTGILKLCCVVEMTKFVFVCSLLIGIVENLDVSDTIINTFYPKIRGGKKITVAFTAVFCGIPL